MLTFIFRIVSDFDSDLEIVNFNTVERDFRGLLPCRRPEPTRHAVDLFDMLSSGGTRLGTRPLSQVFFDLRQAAQLFRLIFGLTE